MGGGPSFNLGLGTNRTFIRRMIHMITYFRAHLKYIHSEAECTACSNRWFPSQMHLDIHRNEKHTQYDVAQNVICSLCSKRQACVFGLLSHIRKDHYNHQPHVCDQCGKSFDIIPRLSAHKKEVHSTELRYFCDKCPRKFTSCGKLYSHRASAHPEGPKAFCEHCGSSFRTRAHLKNHLARIHPVEEKSYPCEECGKTFRLKDLLNSHKKIHVTNEPTVCPVEGCEKIFNRLDRLRGHMKRVHAEHQFKCDFCPRTFSNRLSKKEHENNIHLLVKEFKCTECDFVTARKHNLNTHLKIHSGIMYECDFPGCKKSYNRKGNLDVHKKTSHRIPRPSEKPQGI